jgi:hypothetical protein
VVFYTKCCSAKIVHKRSIRKNKVLLTSVKFLLNEIRHYLIVKGFHENDDLAELLMAKRSANGSTAILKSCGKRICVNRKMAEMKKTILNQIIPGLPIIMWIRHNNINGLSHKMLRFIFIC